MEGENSQNQNRACGRGYKLNKNLLLMKPQEVVTVLTVKDASHVQAGENGDAT